jgi:hypothetical protein
MKKRVKEYFDPVQRGVGIEMPFPAGQRRWKGY